MPVRIYFRGLVLFRFPVSGQGKRTLRVELISEPAGPGAGGPHHHQTEIQIITGRRHMPPRALDLKANIDITIPGDGEVMKSRSFEAHVPKLSAVAAKSNNQAIRGGRAPDDGFVRNVITVNRGIIRARNLVTWDSGGFPLAGRDPADRPSEPAQVKFLGSEVSGHMANECVLEVLDQDSAKISASDKELQGTHESVRAPNPHTSNDTLEILVSNFEYQRRRPVPWGMDFQWLFMAAGYAAGDLSGRELDDFKAFGRRYDVPLFEEDRRTLLPLDPVGLPFPYVIENATTPLSALAEPDSRPICVPGDGE